MPITRTVTTVLLFALAATALAEQRTYRVGNSLTWDSQPRAIGKLAAMKGIEHSQAYHIRCGKPLNYIIEHPDETCVDPVELYGRFGEALRGHCWDAVTFQPHPGAGSTLRTDTACILRFIEMTRENDANDKTVFYIYAPWPARDAGPYHEVWLRDTPDTDDTPTLQTRAYFAHLLKRVRAKTDADVRMIPAGEVLFELDRLARAGALPGYASAHDLYRDRVHLNHAGRFTAGVTVFSTLFQKDPAGLTRPKGEYGDGRKPKKGEKPQPEPPYEAIHRAVWKVVNAVKATGVK